MLKISFVAAFILYISLAFTSPPSSCPSFAREDLDLLVYHPLGKGMNSKLFLNKNKGWGISKTLTTNPHNAKELDTILSFHKNGVQLDFYKSHAGSDFPLRFELLKDEVTLERNIRINMSKSELINTLDIPETTCDSIKLIGTEANAHLIFIIKNNHVAKIIHKPYVD